MDFLAHLFVPRSSNNYRSKLLHHNVLLLLIIFLFLGSFLLVQLKKNYPGILGIATNITSEQLLSLTNQVRQQNGLSSLNLNPELNAAAQQKANDMIEKDYWAHVSPAGTTPWVFIKGSGYNYIYAGENLAKGFSSAQDTINAWMASPTHRENELSPNYQDVGFAVATGKLQGEDTVLIVEEFGGRNAVVAPVKSPSTTSTASNEVVPTVVPKAIPTAVPTTSVNVALSPVKGATAIKPLINSISLSSNLYIAILGTFIFVLFLDMMIFARRKAVRIAGHNMDHILFLATILLAGMILMKGVVV